jgi:hypothetical protein
MKTLHWMTTIGAAALAAACATTGTSAPAATGASAGPVTLGGFNGSEAATYDAEHDRFLVSNTGGGPAQPDQVDNNGFIVALNPDGTVQTARWAMGSDTVQLRSPLGIEASNGVVYLADTPFIRRFDLATAEQLPNIEVPGAAILNDLDVAPDGTIYVTDMGSQDPTTWRVVKIAPDGAVSTLVSGEALGRPNGLDVGYDGKIYLAPVAIEAVVVVTTEGVVERTIPVPTQGNDGIMALPDGIFLSQPRTSTLYKIGYDGSATLLSDQTLGGASLGVDTTRGVVIVPTASQNAVSLFTVE